MKTEPCLLTLGYQSKTANTGIPTWKGIEESFFPKSIASTPFITLVTDRTLAENA